MAWWYATQVVDGRIVAGVHIRRVCERHLRELDDAWARRSPWVYDREAADRICRFAGKMRLNTGQFAGAPLKLLPWQEFWLRSVFGWKVRETGYRRYRRTLVESGKGSGKVALTAAMALYMALFDDEPRAEVYVTAETFEQAGIVMHELVGFVQSSPGLSAASKIIGGLDKPMGVAARDGRGKLLRYTLGNRAPSGVLPHGIFADELHEHTSYEALEMLEAGVKSRRQPLVVLTTNAGHGNTCPYFAERQRAERVASGELDDPTYLPLVYAVDDGDEPLDDEACWMKANPSLPLIPGLPYLRSESAKARVSASTKTRVLRLNFGRWSEGVEAWLDPDAWLEAEVDGLSPGREDVECVIGLDLSLRRDLTSAAVVWDFGDRLEAETTSWTPEGDLLGRQERERQPYMEWVSQGWLRTTPGNYIAYAAIVDWLRGMMERWDVAAVAYDPLGIDELRARLQEGGLRYTMDQRAVRDASTLLMVPHPQGFRRGRLPADNPAEEARRAGQLSPTMPVSIDALEESILQRRLKVVRSPVLRGAANGAYLAEDGSGNRRLMKNKSLTKIDPLMALTMAVGTALARRDASPGYFSDAEFGEFMAVMGAGR